MYRSALAHLRNMTGVSAFRYSYFSGIHKLLMLQGNMIIFSLLTSMVMILTLLHSERPNLNGVLAVLSAVGLRCWGYFNFPPFFQREATFVTSYLLSWTIKPFQKVSTLNPIALRKAKIVYNFGLPECNRVKDTILAFLSAIGLREHFLILRIGQSPHSEERRK